MGTDIAFILNKEETFQKIFEVRDLDYRRIKVIKFYEEYCWNLVEKIHLWKSEEALTMLEGGNVNNINNHLLVLADYVQEKGDKYTEYAQAIRVNEQPKDGYKKLEDFWDLLKEKESKEVNFMYHWLDFGFELNNFYIRPGRFPTSDLLYWASAVDTNFKGIQTSPNSIARECQIKDYAYTEWRTGSTKDKNYMLVLIQSLHNSQFSRRDNEDYTISKLFRAMGENIQNIEECYWG